MNKKCKQCGAQFSAPDDAILFRFVHYCQTCEVIVQKNVERERKDFERRMRENQWNEICPPAYRDTVIEKLPNPEKASEVMKWKYGKTGLLLHGKTRKGKSRCAWLAIRISFDAGISIQILDSMAGFQYAAAFSNSGRDAQEWVEKRSRCGLLFFDDVFKVKLTDSFEAAVFAIVDYRMTHNMPIIATLNDTGETLAARMSSDRGDAFVARLKEMCDVIQF